MSSASALVCKWGVSGRTGQPEGPISIMEQTNSLTSALSFHIWEMDVLPSSASASLSAGPTATWEKCSVIGQCLHIQILTEVHGYRWLSWSRHYRTKRAGHRVWQPGSPHSPHSLALATFPPCCMNYFPSPWQNAWVIQLQRKHGLFWLMVSEGSV